MHLPGQHLASTPPVDIACHRVSCRLVLIEAALAAIRTKDSALGARYRRVMRHRRHKKAVVAVAQPMLRAAHHVLAEGTAYRDPGLDYYHRRRARQATRRAVELLERQGYRAHSNPRPERGAHSPGIF